MLGPGDGHDIGALGQHPSQGDLCRGAAFLTGHLLDCLGQAQVALEVLALEARMVAPEVVLGQIPGCLETPGKEPPPERAVGHKTHFEFAAGGQDLAFRVASPQRVLGLKSGNGMYRTGSTKCRRRCLGQPQVADLAGPHQFRHGADGFLDRRGRVNAMLVREVDDLDPESLGACLARPAQILRPPADVQELALGPAFGEFIAVRQAAGMKVSTVNRALATVRRMFNLAQEWGKVTTRLARVRLNPGENQRMRVLTVEEECAYLKAASDTAHGIQQAYEEALQGVRAAVRGEQPIKPDAFLLPDLATVPIDCGFRPEE